MFTSIRALPLALTASFLTATVLSADTWIQIEAQPSVGDAERAVEGYSEGLPNVAAFDSAGAWNVVVVGPYATRNEADAARRLLRREGLIPIDSFLVEEDRLGTQIAGVFETGIDSLEQGDTTPEVAANAAAVTPETSVVEAEPAATIAPIVDETPREARASESRLDREQKKDLQRALQFAGFYKSTIDGSYGNGTRRAMSAWQEANGYEPTGVLTTAQRAQVTKFRQPRHRDHRR